MKHLTIIVFFIISGCATTTDYSLQLASANCGMLSGVFKYSIISDDKPSFLTIGKNSNCYKFNTGDSYYEAFNSKSSISKIIVRSYHNAYLPGARIFLPLISEITNNTVNSDSLKRCGQKTATALQPANVRLGYMNSSHYQAEQGVMRNERI